MRWFLLFILCILPQISHAAIVVSEVAWMGTTMSPDDEWIELHNTSNAGVSVDGWSLSDGNNLSIPLSGSIPSDAYAVLERTDDSTVPGNAFLIYKGALTNAGATLTLYRSDGSIEDQVVGGEN